MIKRTAILSLIAALIFTMLPFSSPVVRADSTVSTTIYVATDGDDNTGNGSKANPYKTLAKAKEVVRTLPKNNGDIVVQIADGFYPIDEPLVFTSEDSGTEASTIRYEAAPGAKPVISGGDMLPKGVWTEATGLTQTGGLTAYKTTLNRNDKLRAIYVNDKIANMTLSPEIGSSQRTIAGTPTVSFTSDNNPWAWQGGSNIQAGIVFDKNVGLTTNTKNPQNIEAESTGGSTARWSRPFVTFASIEAAPAASNKPDGVMLRFQLPYGIVSQSLSNNTQYNPNNNQVIRNAFEFFNKRGDFYFDQAESTLYYIPLEGEDINTADVVIPRHETIIDIRGIPVGDRLNPQAGSDDGRVKHITFDGLTFAHTDYKLYELEGTYTLSDGSGPVTTSSRGYASVQGSIVNTVYFQGHVNWHETFYRGYDIPPAAVMINAARNIKVLNGAIMLTGFNGIHVENDVKDIEITGNYIADTLASGAVIGHPQHIYENDEPVKHESSASANGTPIKNWAGVNKEKFAAGTEAVPENIYFTNNFLFRNCYGFPGANSFTSFYTTNMQVLHNFIYDTTYGGMSIGWGWDEYDGFGFTSHGNNKEGGPYHGTHETSLARSPEITTTSRNNKVNYNRVEKIATVVNDTGAIYTLGRQGDPGNLPGGGTWDTVNHLSSGPVTDMNSNWHPDNWTNYTEMMYNFLDPNPENKPTDWNNWTNGFHPDEGSTFIKMIGNVVQSKLSHSPGRSRLFELNNWKRKSDMIAVGGYVDGDNDQNGAPRIVYDNYKSEQRIWPLEGNEIVLNAGLTDEYVHMIPSSIIADTEFELASNVIVGTGGEELSRRGLLKAEDTVWLAPANTTVFVEGDTMTKAAGNEKTIITPAAKGEYKLYIVYEDGRPTATSKYTVYVDPSQSATNVENGKDYEVSVVKPLVLSLSNDFNFTLNGSPVTNGYEISTEGSWILVGTSDTLPTVTFSFTTSISMANKLLPANVTVAPGGDVRFAYDMDDETKQVWISSASGGHFDGGDSESMTLGDAIGMKAPLVPGPYVIYILAADGRPLSQSHAQVVVSATEPVNPVVDKALLINLVENVSDKDFTVYTSQSWSVFADALYAAQTAILENEIDQADADLAYYLLRDAIQQLQVDDEQQYVEVLNEDFSSYNEGTGTLNDSIWTGQNNQVSVTADKQLRFAPTAGSNIRAQTADVYGDMELTFDFNVVAADWDEGFYIYLRTTDRTIQGNRDNKNSFELAINPNFWSKIRLFEHVNNANQYQLSADTNVQTNNWYSSKIILEGDMLYAKFWPRNSEEPAAWSMSGKMSNGAMQRATGHISFEFYGNGKSALIDNVVVKELGQPNESGTISGISSVGLGEPVTLPLGIKNVSNGFDTLAVKVNYDPEIMEFETVTEGGTVSLADSAITNLRNNWSIVSTVVDEDVGEIIIHASTANGSLDGNSGKLLELNGKAINVTSTGGTSITLSDFILTKDGADRSITTDNAIHVLEVVTIPVTGISLNETELSLTEDEQFQIIATVKPTNATNKEVAWSSSDENVATVDENGVVTAVEAGVATITATTVDGGFTATASITVEAEVAIIPVTGISLNTTEITLTEGEQSQIIATVEPSDASNKAVVWSSSDENVVTIDENGVVTAVEAGAATITATTVDGGFTATASITVNAVDITKPNEVSNVNVTAGDQQLVLTWEDPANIVKVKLVVNGGTITDEAYEVEQGVETLVLSDLSNGTAYEIKISTIDADDNESEGITVFGTPAAPSESDTTPPGDVTRARIVVGDKKLTIRWTDPTDDDLDSIKISGHGNTEIDDVYVDKGVETYTFNGLNNNTKYEFIITALDTSDNESAGVIVQGTPKRSTVNDNPGNDTPPATSTPNPTANPSNEPKVDVNDNGQVNVKPTTDANGNSEVKLAADTIKNAIEQSKDGKLQITVEPDTSLNDLKVEFPVDELFSNEQASIENVEIDAGLATVTVSTSLISNHTASAKNVSVQIAKSDTSSLPANAQGELKDADVYDFYVSVDGQSISQFNGRDDVKMSVPYELKPGENPNKVVIYFVNELGELEVVKNSRYNAETGMLEFKPKHNGTYAAAHVEASFTDVSQAWAQDAIDALAARGIVKGIGEGRFNPEGNITRAEFITMIMNVFDLTNEEAMTTLSDVKTGAWYYNPIATAQELGIVKGRTDGSFGVNDVISRQDMAVMAYQAAMVAQLKLSEGSKEGFTDQQSIADYAKDAVAAMQAAEIINGMGNGQFEPQSFATRAQAAVIIYKLLNQLSNQ